MAGENTGQTKRIKSNLKTKDNQIPILHGTSKDHKIVANDEEGPDVRPIMGAVVGPNVGLSNFLGREIIRRVAEDINSENVCKSTEELLSRFERYNKNRVENGFHEETRTYTIRIPTSNPYLCQHVQPKKAKFVGSK